MPNTPVFHCPGTIVGPKLLSMPINTSPGIRFAGPSLFVHLLFRAKGLVFAALPAVLLVWSVGASGQALARFPKAQPQQTATTSEQTRSDLPPSDLPQAGLAPSGLPPSGLTPSGLAPAPRFQPMGSDADGFVHLLVQGDPAVLAQTAASLGGSLKYAIGNRCALRVPARQWRALLGHPAVLRMDGTGSAVQPLGDVMLVHSRVDSVQAGYAPLPHAYDGQGVIVGLVDLGIDFTHPDFRDSLDRTRINYIWDQNLPDDGSAPSPYGYGQECDSAAIEALACAHIDPNLSYSHGSGVAGVSAGNGRATGQYRGVAPAADIIAVNLAFNNTFLSNVVDAIRYIFDKADAAGKPCVINTSVGTYLGSHDGQDLAAQMIDSMLAARAGRAVVAAVGNAGDRIFHLGYEANADTAFTWFRYESALGAAYLQAWIDTADAPGWNFAVGADQPTGWSFRGRSPFWNLTSDLDLSSGVDSIEHDLFNGPNRLGFIKCWVSRQGPAYLVEVAVFPDSTSLRWRLETTGSGRIDAWTDPAVTGTSYLFRGTDLPASTVFPDIVHYRAPDGQSTLVSSWQCSDRVIAVGSYYNRNSMINYYGASPPISGTPETRILSSSNGPTRHGLIKPDVSASGQWVLASGSTNMTNWLIGLGAANYIAPGGRHYLQGGTSFSSPIVAGIAALYLQRYPNASYAAVKNALVQGARQDAFTGTALPDNQWGHGKVNAFASLQISDQTCATPDGVTVTHTTSSAARMVWNPVEDAIGYVLEGRRLGTDRWVNRYSYTSLELVPSLRAAADYEFRIRALCGVADTSAWSAFVTFSTLAAREGVATARVSLSPNPVQDRALLEYSGLSGTNGMLELFDLPGKRVAVLALTGSEGLVEWMRGDLAAGVYIYRVSDNGQTVYTDRLLLP